MKKILIVAGLICLLLALGVGIFLLNQRKPLLTEYFHLPIPKVQVAHSPTPLNKTPIVFIILMENKDWAQIYKNSSAPYLNSLLSRNDVTYASQYFGIAHPSEPNYVWLEAGDAFNLPNGDTTVSFDKDYNPSADKTTTTPDHLVNLLEKAGVTWRTYAEGISGTECPLYPDTTNKYAPKHNPMVFFSDVTDNNNPASTRCIEHIRPFSELATDLKNQTVAQYNFIVPSTCDDMHDSTGCPAKSEVVNGDQWLQTSLPPIFNSSVYQKDGVLFITWDEDSGSPNNTNPIGLIMFSPFAKKNGYHNDLHYTHSSLLKTVQEIFNVQPLLRNAKTATDLSDLFAQWPIKITN